MQTHRDADATLSGMLDTGNTWTWPTNIQYPSTYYVAWSRNVSPVRLKLSEIEKLRAAAKKDKALKAVLQKFTHAIEIEVDFE